jgi:hypothetical protein
MSGRGIQGADLEHPQILTQQFAIPNSKSPILPSFPCEPQTQNPEPKTLNLSHSAFFIPPISPS